MSERREPQPHPVVVPAGLYRHYQGGLYRVLFQQWESTNGRPRDSLVCYVSLATGEINSRLTTEFVELLPEGPNETFRRFQPMMRDDGAETA